MSASGDPTVGEHEAPAEAEGDHVGREFARLTAKLLGRAREQTEDILAEAQSVRQEERSVARRTAVYGLAGLLKATDVIGARAREAAAAAQAGARGASEGYAAATRSRDTARSPRTAREESSSARDDDSRSSSGSSQATS